MTTEELTAIKGALALLDTWRVSEPGKEPLLTWLAEGLSRGEPCEGIIRRLVAEVEQLSASVEWCRQRMDLLQREQQRMRDPERTLVCDILANGSLLPDPTGARYGRPVAEIYELRQREATLLAFGNAATARADSLAAEVEQHRAFVEAFKAHMQAKQALKTFHDELGHRAIAETWFAVLDAYEKLEG
jgi:hypothetical protein